MNAAITAGGRVGGELASQIGSEVKALARVRGITLLDAAIDAARLAGAARISVIGGDEVRRHCASRVDAVVAEAPDGRDNLRLAIESGATEPLLLLSSDLPFVTGAPVAEFVERARAARVELALPLARGSDYEHAFPGAPPHLTRLGDERVANGSVVYFAAGVAPKVLSVSQQFFDARKSLLRMAVLLGPGLLLRFAARRLRIEHLEARAQRVLGIRAGAIRDASPSLCFDIDTIDDYRYALAYQTSG